MYPAGTVSILFLSALGLSLESSESLYVAGFGFWGVLCRAEASGGPRALLYVIVTYVCRHRLSVCGVAERGCRQFGILPLFDLWCNL
jgi:hypothetical protein